MGCRVGRFQQALKREKGDPLKANDVLRTMDVVRLIQSKCSVHLQSVVPYAPATKPPWAIAACQWHPRAPRPQLPDPKFCDCRLTRRSSCWDWATQSWRTRACR